MNKTKLIVLIVVLASIFAGCISSPSTNEKEVTAVVTPVAPESITLNGSGQTATEAIFLPRGLTRFEMVHNGRANFIIWLLDDEGNKKELLVNEIGSFSGSKAIRIPTAGKYVLDIYADGNWAVRVTK